jgi:peptidoglycan lytic transglycosylase G
VARGKATGRGTKPHGRRGKAGGGWRRIAIGLGILLLLLLVPAGQMAWSWWKLQRPYKGYTGAEKLVSVEPGSGASQILQALEGEGVLADAQLARTYLIYFMGDPKVQAGEYLFRGPLTTSQVLDMLVRGDVVTRFVTIVEGLALEEIAEQLARERFGRREVFLDLMRSPRLIADLDPDAPDLEGYLFPETYSFASGTGEREIVETLVRTFRRRFEREVQPRMAAGPPGRTVRQVVTLASIVEKEARVPTERPLIAAVYNNRLERGIGLAADPTVIYALKRLGRWNGNLRREDLRMDSRYNTYRWAGLPPGPICSPGLASLTAAADPAEVPYLYFVGRNDGTHVFAETLEEHNRNVETWQRRYWRHRWAQERRERQGPSGGGR